jgi:cyclase
MQIEKILGTLYKFTLSSNDFTVNVGACIGEDGILLIDTGWPQTAEELKKEMRELDDGIVKWIIITHPHGDHIGGRELLGENATLIAHKNAKDELAGKYFGLDVLPGQALPIITVDNELSLCTNSEDIEIIHAPGHTDSDMVVHFINAGVVYLGDVVLSDTFPPLDLVRGGNAEHYIESMGKLIDLFPADVKLITGHGRDYSLDDLREHHRMAVNTIDLIKQGMADGNKPQDMVSEDLLKDWTSWSRAQVTSETWITQVYESLTDQGRKPISDPLTYTIMDKGIEAAIEQYMELKKDQPDSYTFAENDLNMLGYNLLWRDMKEEAIGIFKLNIQAYPKSANPYDSLGEAYLASGDEKLAIENYEKAVSIDPNFSSAVDALRRLRSKSEG